MMFVYPSSVFLLDPSLHSSPLPLLCVPSRSSLTPPHLYILLTLCISHPPVWNRYVHLYVYDFYDFLFLYDVPFCMSVIWDDYTLPFIGTLTI